ncbi:uncharacterized protein PFL1_05451 [Pseudozyma flocculosa PF-1]|uniref:SAM domain-containing protein n=1 Tax=Pseudozyma flocculosa PF-1 TaxID=1277687 RepID=A0A061H886_9BASI|nr:uncharacterized protein PFL1_05451 [Pseudozyma flocculosa PF-1]EPQ26816.1 hypothetical protein PFL1_05451 [Pseudozyma flocculosa PF-1]
MSDFTSLRPPLSPSGAGLNRASLPGGFGGPRGLRPSSEMLNTGHHAGTPESEAIDRWFEDLQHYEATLEEMAAASLDQNFKEELSAIEQWFRVLSEAERTAALYSLLQESTQVQIRFFITVLQQMASSDPVTALLSPNNPNTSMVEQMEAKLASLGLKSPAGSAIKAPASPGAGASNRHYQRQSTDAAGYLSPNVAAMYNSQSGNDAASALAAQRARLKANRTSAPGTLRGESRNFSGGNLDQVAEQRAIERSASPASDAASRPKSTDLSNMAGRSPRVTGPLDDQLSPITATGNWSSMVNTPLVPMFSEQQISGGGEANVNLDAAAAQLAGLGQHHHASDSSRVLIDPDVSKYRRKSAQNGQASQQPQHHQQQHQQQHPHTHQHQHQSGPGQVQGVLSNMYDLQHGVASSPGLSPNMAAQAGWGASPLTPQNAAFGGAGSGGFNIGAMSPNALAGLQSPTGGMSNPLNLQMMNAMAAMSGLNLNNMNAAQFLAMQQQILQNQQSLAAFAQQSQQAGGSSQQGGGGGAGGADEEVPDLSVLNDVAQWLRHLRLHKYTPNFEKSSWREMVVMSDKDLEDKGVAALGARRKMLKTFEATRQKYGITMPGEDASGGDDNKAAAEGAAETKNDDGAAAAAESGEAQQKKD